jgi:small subunit ribosomal protein S13
MARLAGVDLPREKRLEIALTYIYGIGKSHAQETLAATGVSPDIRVKDLGDDDLLKLRDYIDEHFRVEGDLRREVAADIRRKVEIGCYQGLRHRRGLPVHGQRTKTNARSSKGPRKTIAGKTCHAGGSPFSTSSKVLCAPVPVRPGRAPAFDPEVTPKGGVRLLDGRYC